MQLGRFEIGIWTNFSNKYSLRDYFEVDYENSLCGCKILTISRLYFTWMNDECYENSKKVL